MHRILLIALAGVAGCASAQRPIAGPETYDVLIRNGTVIDGTGAGGYRADVAISGDRIALVSRTPLANAPARRSRAAPIHCWTV
jgi:N-acyl-D-amino-acid deacylase